MKKVIETVSGQVHYIDIGGEIEDEDAEDFIDEGWYMKHLLSMAGLDEAVITDVQCALFENDD